MVVEFISNLLAGSPESIIIFEIGMIMIIATIFAFIIKALKQPLIPAYILAGIIVGPALLGLVKNQDLILSLSEIGVAFLIFTAGLEIKFKKLKEVGSTIAVVGILQVVITFAIAFLVSMALGFYNQSAIYIGLIVAFSSTMIVLKVLADRREINSLHGRIIIGILLIQDVVAIVALMILSSEFSFMSLAIIAVKAILFILLTIVMSRAINPVLGYSAKNHELMLLVSISFLFLFVIASYLGGFSLIIGAFFAGVCLANSDYKTEIEGKIIPLREFFSVIFFVSLGMQLRLIPMNYVYILFALFLLVIVIKPLIIMFLVRIFGYKKSTSFLTGNSLGQTSEFSLILATMALGLGHITESLFSTLVLLTIITMSLTNYFIGYEKKFEKWFSWPLNILSRIKSKEELEYYSEGGKKVIIIGCHRMGSLFVKEFENNKEELFVVDYNPEVIRNLMHKQVPCVYGDFANEEVFEKAEIKRAEIIISTIPDIDDNLVLLKKIRRINKNALVFIVADRISEALQLYDRGADYVILPQIVGGQKVSQIIEKTGINRAELARIKKEHIKYLDSIHKILY